MCSRTELSCEQESLEHRLAAELGRAVDSGGRAIEARDEILRTDDSPVLVHRFGGGTLLAPMKWGVPGPEHAPDKVVPNARRESLGAPFWRDHLRERRCVAVVTGWFESPEIDGKKVRYRFKPADGCLLYFPGVYTDGPSPTYATVTVEPGEFAARYMPREPVTLAPEEVEAWLNPNATPADLMALLRQAPPWRLVAEPAPRTPKAKTKPPPVQGSLFGDLPPKKRPPS